MKIKRNKEQVSSFRLLKKIRTYIGEISFELLFRVLSLYNTLRAPETPLWCRGVILGSLGYFLSTIDGIPDFTPVLGFSDDMTVLAAAIATVGHHITPEIKRQSRQQALKISRRFSSNHDIPAN